MRWRKIEIRLKNKTKNIRLDEKLMMERIVKSEKFEKHSIEGENKDETQEIKTGFVDRRGELGNLLY